MSFLRRVRVQGWLPLGLGLAVVIGQPIPIARASSIAEPRLVLIYGSLLNEPIIVSEWREQIDLMDSITRSITIDTTLLAGRPYFQVAMFWDTKWNTYADEKRPLTVLKPDQADEHAKFYPAVNGQRPLFVYDGDPNIYGRSSASAGLARSIEQQGLDYFVRHGVQIRF